MIFNKKKKNGVSPSEAMDESKTFELVFVSPGLRRKPFREKQNIAQ